MEKYIQIGTLYYLDYQYQSYIWMVVENNLNNKTTILEIIDECEEKGKQITVSTEKLSNVLPLGPVIEPNGEIVLENGIEYIKKKSYIKK